MKQRSTSCQRPLTCTHFPATCQSRVSKPTSSSASCTFPKRSNAARVSRVPSIDRTHARIFSRQGFTSFLQMLKDDHTISKEDARPGKWEQCRSFYRSSDFLVAMLRAPRDHVLSQYLECRYDAWGKRMTRGTGFPLNGTNEGAGFKSWLAHFSSPKWRPWHGDFNCYNPINMQAACALALAADISATSHCESQQCIHAMSSHEPWCARSQTATRNMLARARGSTPPRSWRTRRFRGCTTFSTRQWLTWSQTWWLPCRPVAKPHRMLAADVQLTAAPASPNVSGTGRDRRSRSA